MLIDHEVREQLHEIRDGLRHCASFTGDPGRAKCQFAQFADQITELLAQTKPAESTQKADVRHIATTS